MISSLWDICVLDEIQKKEILKFDDELEDCDDDGRAGADLDNSDAMAVITDERFGSGIDGLQSVLVQTEASCHHFMDELDSILEILSNISSAHNDVTGRTNSLMLNCENLLEQQVIVIIA